VNTGEEMLGSSSLDGRATQGLDLLDGLEDPLKRYIGGHHGLGDQRGAGIPPGLDEFFFSDPELPYQSRAPVFDDPELTGEIGELVFGGPERLDRGCRFEPELKLLALSSDFRRPVVELALFGAEFGPSALQGPDAIGGG